MIALAVSGLAKSFGGVRAVDGVSFRVAAGERVALIGPNGAGKTTCFNLLNGQLRPDRGTVRLFDDDITGRAPRAMWRRGVGRTFQVTETYGSMSVCENVQMALIARQGAVFDFRHRAAALYRDAAMAMLARIGMAEDADRPCGILSYGSLKRLELALAFASAPRLLLLDEPTAGLAAAERPALMALATVLAQEHGTSLLFTEHDMDVVFAVAERVIVLDRGRVIAEGPPAAVRADPRVREVYLGADFA